MRTTPLILIACVLAEAADAQPQQVGPREYSIQESRVNVSTGNLQQYPSLGVFGDQFIVGWEGWQLGNADCYGRRYDSNGVPLGGEFLLNPCVTSGWEYGPAFAPLPTGGFAVAWGRNSADVYVQGFDAAASPSGCQQLVANRNVWPSVSSSTVTGQSVIAWGRFGFGVNEVGARFYDPSGSPVGPPVVVNSQPLGFSANALILASVAMSAAGVTCVAWYHGSGDIRARLYDPTGVALAPEFTVNSSTGGDRFHPSVGFTAGGSAIVAWDGYGSFDSAGVYARAFDSSGAPLGPEWAVHEDIAGVQYYANVGTGDGDEFAISWTGPDGSGVGVFGRLHLGPGMPLGSEFQVSQYTANAQQTPWSAGRHGCAIQGSTMLFTWYGEGPGDADGSFLTRMALSSEVFGTGCPGNAGVPTIAVTEPPTLGNSVEIMLDDLPPGQPAWMALGFSRDSWNGIPLPFPLDGVGMPGCVLLVSPDIVFPLGPTPGFATWTHAVPNQAALLGARFYNQGVAADPGVNGPGVILSPGACSVIQ